MKRYLLLFLLPLLVAAAPDQDLYEFDHLTLRLQLENELSIVPESGSWRVDSVQADLSWYPRYSYRQTVEDIVTQPPASLEEAVYQYTWTKPRQTTLDFSHTSLIKTSDLALPVRAKVVFPISSLPADIAWYTQEAELIDTNEDIMRKAYQLAAGKDDLFEVVYTVADWVTTNIEYDLKSIAANANEPSSWVMENREGVCDEMTSLFISMLRSLGIPARFVSGVSYTNLPEFAEPWGGHGWAEVWFPETGWVPFDVTYGTYGYVDATHIKLKDALDAGGSSVEFTMLSRDANLITKSLNIDVQVREKRKEQQDLFSVTLEPFEDAIGLDSYNLITATVKNNKAYYVSTRLQLARTENLELLDSHERNILLKPYATTKLHYILKTKQLSPGFYYDFPVKIYAGFREMASASFGARNGQPAYGKSFFSEYLSVTENEKPYNDDASLACVANPEALHLDQNVKIDCELTNKGNTAFTLVQACIDKECTRLEVAPGEKETFSMTTSCENAGVKTLIATAKSRQVSLFALAHYECVDEAKIELIELTHPDSLGFDEHEEIVFTVRKKSETLPKNVDISITHDNFAQSWHLDEFLQPQKFSLGIRGESLDLKNNDVTVKVSYEDKLGQRYDETETFTIEPKNFSFGQKLQIRLLNIERWIQNALS
ncbi:transglutaminase domain-containing protein [Candidatus Woesearchaeota archaeon]|nr:transglutaminase domain-containing protein [Candidatus Woesearchaeota archaeon]